MPMRYRLFFFILCIFALYIFLAPTRASSRNVLLKYAPLRSADIVIVIDRSPSLNLVTDATVDAAKFLLDYVDAIDPQHEYVRIAIIPFTKSPLKDKERLLAPLDDEAWETIEKLRNGSNLVDNTNFSAALCRAWYWLSQDALVPDRSRFIVLFSDGKSYPTLDSTDLFNDMLPKGFLEKECYPPLFEIPEPSKKPPSNIYDSIEMASYDNQVSANILSLMKEKTIGSGVVNLYSVIFADENEDEIKRLINTNIWWFGENRIFACAEQEKVGNVFRCIKAHPTEELSKFFGDILNKELSITGGIGFRPLKEGKKISIQPGEYTEKVIISVILPKPITGDQIVKSIKLFNNANTVVLPKRILKPLKYYGEFVYDLSVITGQEIWELTTSTDIQVAVKEIGPRFYVSIPDDRYIIGINDPLLEIDLIGEGKRLPHGILNAHLVDITDLNKATESFTLFLGKENKWESSIKGPMLEGYYNFHLLDPELDKFIVRSSPGIGVFPIPDFLSAIIQYNWDEENWLVVVPISNADKLPKNALFTGTVQLDDEPILSYKMTNTDAALVGRIDTNLPPDKYLLQIVFPKVRTIDGVIVTQNPLMMLHGFYELPTIEKVNINLEKQNISVLFKKLFNFKNMQIELNSTEGSVQVIPLDCPDLRGKPILEIKCSGKISIKGPFTSKKAAFSAELSNGDRIELVEYPILISIPAEIIQNKGEPTPTTIIPGVITQVSIIIFILSFIILSLLSSYLILRMHVRRNVVSELVENIPLNKIGDFWKGLEKKGVIHRIYNIMALDDVSSNLVNICVQFSQKRGDENLQLKRDKLAQFAFIEMPSRYKDTRDKFFHRTLEEIIKKTQKMGINMPLDEILSETFALIFWDIPKLSQHGDIPDLLEVTNQKGLKIRDSDYKRIINNSLDGYRSALGWWFIPGDYPNPDDWFITLPETRVAENLSNVIKRPSALLILTEQNISELIKTQIHYCNKYNDFIIIDFEISDKLSINIFDEQNVIIPAKGWLYLDWETEPENIPISTYQISSDGLMTYERLHRITGNRFRIISQLPKNRQTINIYAHAVPMEKRTDYLPARLPIIKIDLGGIEGNIKISILTENNQLIMLSDQYEEKQWFMKQAVMMHWPLMSSETCVDSFIKSVSDEVNNNKVKKSFIAPNLQTMLLDSCHTQEEFTAVSALLGNTFENGNYSAIKNIIIQKLNNLPENRNNELRILLMEIRKHLIEFKNVPNVITENKLAKLLNNHPTIQIQGVLLRESILKKIIHDWKGQAIYQSHNKFDFLL